MAASAPTRVHVVTGGFPPGSHGGHDMDYARLKLLDLLYDDGNIRATTGNDFTDMWKWLQVTDVLITYTAGPVADDEQNEILKDWIDNGGHWLGLHGTSGGKAARIGDGKRQMVKMNHHLTLGGFFINHPPIKRFTVDVKQVDSPILEGLPDQFDVIDEPYMIEVTDRPNTDILLTAPIGPDTYPDFGFDYEEDTAIEEDGVTRVFGFTRGIGEGGVCYIALGHCHSPMTNSQPFVEENARENGEMPRTLRFTWETEEYRRLLANSLNWARG